jgi:hypothetical protein
MNKKLGSSNAASVGLHRASDAATTAARILREP